MITPTRVKKAYIGPVDRDMITADMEAQGYTLIEDQIHFDGNWLIFERDHLAEWKGRWQAAPTANQKIQVLAEFLGLEVAK